MTAATPASSPELGEQRGSSSAPDPTRVPALSASSSALGHAGRVGERRAAGKPHGPGGRRQSSPGLPGGQSPCGQRSTLSKKMPERRPVEVEAGWTGSRTLRPQAVSAHTSKPNVTAFLPCRAEGAAGLPPPRETSDQGSSRRGGLMGPTPLHLVMSLT